MPTRGTARAMPPQVDVTIGLPFYNDASHLTLALQSVFAQTYQNWELILVDDNSQDGCLELARAIDDPRVRVIADGTNRGLPVRLNQIASMAKAPLVARMDADDVMTPDRLEAQIEVFASAPLDLVATAAWTIDGSDRPYGVRGRQPPPSNGRGYLKNAVYIHPTVMATRDWFLANPYDETSMRAQDKELWCRTYCRTLVCVMPEPYLFYRELGNFSFARYRETCSADRVIIRRYGPSLVGRRTTGRMLISSVLKESMYCVARGSWFGGFMVKRRSERLTSADLKQAFAQLDVVRGTAIPGLVAPHSGQSRLS